MSAFTSEDLELLEEVVSEFSVSTCTIKRPVRSSDGKGGYSSSGSDAAVASNISCRVANPSGREKEIAAKLSSAVNYTVTLPVGTAIQTRDYILVGSRRFEVHAVLTPISDPIRVKVLCSEIV